MAWRRGGWNDACEAIDAASTAYKLNFVKLPAADYSTFGRGMHGFFIFLCCFVSFANEGSSGGFNPSVVFAFVAPAPSRSLVPLSCPRRS